MILYELLAILTCYWRMDLRLIQDISNNNSNNNRNGSGSLLRGLLAWL